MHNRTEDTSQVRVPELKELLLKRDPSFWPKLTELSRNADRFSDLMTLSTLRKRASRLCPPSNQPVVKLKIAILGGSTLYPLSELIEHLLSVTAGEVELKLGDFNNYRSEILESPSEFRDFHPDFVILIPDANTCRYVGETAPSRETVEAHINQVSTDLLELCSAAHKNLGAEVLLCNFLLPPNHDLGPLRVRHAASDWNFKKAVNYSLAVNAPNCVHICDAEFLAYRLGGLAAIDERAWFESKQMYSPSLQVALAQEIVHIIDAQRKTPKKVLVLDLDNTLWGGVIGDDGLDGIELGDTSPRGEAFKAFQAYILSLSQRGVLLGVCSKNDFENAIEPFRSHPEMVLREDHFVSFKANWEPKAANLKTIAEELSLGLDSFVFVDDNPAEIEIVRQFTPEVDTILLGEDPAYYSQQLQESRLFELSNITAEDERRTRQYQEERERKSLMSSAVDINSYLESLGMSGTISQINNHDLPRVAQLINKSNQFNLTTKRRTEAEIETLMLDPRYTGFSMRLLDRFGDHGLISVVICEMVSTDVLEIDTWLMSCRVLKRQVEDEIINEIFRIAEELGCCVVRGIYIPTPKNSMVSDLYERFGFRLTANSDEIREYELGTDKFRKIQTHIDVLAHSNYDNPRSKRSNKTTAVHI